MRSGTATFVLLLAAMAPGMHADEAVPNPTAVLRLAGNSQLGGLVDRWAAGFRQLHPEVRIETHLTGSDTGMAALYTGQADLALLGREPTASEIQAFEWIHLHRPAQVEVATGSLDRPGRSPALVVFVRRDNPIRSLTLAQLGAVFGAEPGSASASPRTWDLLGLSGEWAGRPVHLYGPDATSGTGRFFRSVVLHSSRMMNWAQLTEFHDTALSGPGADDAGKKALAALSGDPFGLAVASLGDATDSVRPVALAATAGSEAVAATRETVTAREYPLSRAVLACYDRPPGGHPSPLVGEFLDYVLGPAGQQAITADEGWLPLPSIPAVLHPTSS
jgi:phosphate transport system substrate-binding protein